MYSQYRLYPLRRAASRQSQRARSRGRSDFPGTVPVIRHFVVSSDRLRYRYPIVCRYSSGSCRRTLSAHCCSSEGSAEIEGTGRRDRATFFHGRHRCRGHTNYLVFEKGTSPRSLTPHFTSHGCLEYAVLRYSLHIPRFDVPDRGPVRGPFR